MMRRQLVKWLMLIAVALVATMASADMPRSRVDPRPVPVEWRDGISKDVCIFGGIAVIALIVVSFVLLLAVKRKLNVEGLMTIVFLALVLIVFWLRGVMF